MYVSNQDFPDPRNAPGDAPLAIGGRLSTDILLRAYSRGIFPWYQLGSPILWWSPDPRFTLALDAFHIPKSLQRRLKEPHWHVTADHAFSQVIEACGRIPRPGQEGTWLTPAMRAAYTKLYRADFAHSIEVWQDHQLIGGLYGVALGKAFFGESMFHTAPDASKVALVCLVELLRRRGYHFIDCQQKTAHLARFGAEEWPRDRFLDALETALAVEVEPGSWARETFLSEHEDSP